MKIEYLNRYYLSNLNVVNRVILPDGWFIDINMGEAIKNCGDADIAFRGHSKRIPLSRVL